MNFLIHLSAFLAVATFPLYLFSSGGLQISHMFFGVLLLLFGNTALRARRRLPVAVRRVFFALAAFVAFVSIVQTAGALVYRDKTFLLYGSFYIFNCIYLFTLTVYLWIHGRRASQMVYLGTICAIGLASIDALIGYSGGAGRESGFFNNPNQLGYFGVVALTMVLIFHTSHLFKYSRAVSLCAILAAFYLCTVSLSKAAMISSAVGILLFIPMFSRRELVLLAVAAILTVPLWAPMVVQSEQYRDAVRRIQHIGQDHDDSFSSRGYARLARYPEYLIVGAGEGYFMRFGSSLEIHATIANIVFSYGVIGALLFAVFLVRLLKLSPILFLIVFAPSFLYGLTHNGIRSSFFWLLVAVFINVAMLARQDLLNKRARGSVRGAYASLRNRPRLAGMHGG